MAKLMDIPSTFYTPGSSDKKKLIDEVLKKMWKFNSTYLIGSKCEEQFPVWYIMDEFGSRVQLVVNPISEQFLFYTPHESCVYFVIYC